MNQIISAWQRVDWLQFINQKKTIQLESIWENREGLLLSATFITGVYLILEHATAAATSSNSDDAESLRSESDQRLWTSGQISCEFENIVALQFLPDRPSFQIHHRFCLLFAFPETPAITSHSEASGCLFLFSALCLLPSSSLQQQPPSWVACIVIGLNQWLTEYMILPSSFTLAPFIIRPNLFTVTVASRTCRKVWVIFYRNLNLLK